jgi:small subunit ribosomal protein S3
MGQKVNPNSLRLGIIRGWEANWFASKNSEFAQKLIEDTKIRKYIYQRINAKKDTKEGNRKGKVQERASNKGSISKIVIERNPQKVIITIHTARPGVVIGKGGEDINNISAELKSLFKKEIQINIYEIKHAEFDARLVGEAIAQQLEGRVSHRRAMKQAMQNAMKFALGIKVKLSGRLAGADMARTEQYKEGRVPLHTLRADIDYAISEAQTIYGKIGVKVWIFKREVYGKQDLSLNAGGAIATERNNGQQGGKNNYGDNRNNRNDKNNKRGDGNNDRNNNNRNNNNRNNNKKR